MNKKYKSLNVSAELHGSIKVEAILRKMTIGQYLQYLREVQPKTKFTKSI